VKSDTVMLRGHVLSGCRRQGKEVLPVIRVMKCWVAEEWPLCNDAAWGVTAVGINGSGGLGCRLGRREDGSDGEE
jgi:hypothetical protein